MATVRKVLATKESVTCDDWIQFQVKNEATHARTHTSIQHNKIFLSEFIKNMPSYGLQSTSLSRTNACHRQLLK
jgi:hypothetical protein